MIFARAAEGLMRISIVVVLLLTATIGCGGGSPSTPTPTPTPRPTPVSGWPAGTAIQVVSGETGQPVDALMVVGGTPVQPGVPLATAAPTGAVVEISAAGYITRQTIVRTGESRFSLWPDTQYFPAEYTKRLVYTAMDRTTLEPLRRLPDRVKTVSLVPSPELQADWPATYMLEGGAYRINAVTESAGVRYVVGGTGDLAIPLRVDPANAECTDRVAAFVQLWLGSAGEITRAEVVYCDIEHARHFNIVDHELGHTYGLRHSMDHNDMMAGGGRETPTDREALVMRLLAQRRPGTVWPDDDRSVRSAAVRHEIVID